MGELFGTDGIRGVAGQYPLDPPTIERIAYALARELERTLDRAPRIIIGRDTRESGEWIEEAIFRGLRAASSTARSAGIITTPGVAYLTRTLGADAGIVISASHNPYQDNGIKIFSPSGQKLDDATELSIERELKDGAANLQSMENPAETAETDPTLQEKYLAFLREEIGPGLGSMKIVIDCANGASYRLAPRLFTSLGAQLTVINAEPNGRNINLDCGSLHPENLQAAVLQNCSDLGIAFDGDADRLLMVDETGRLIDGDQILFIMADYLWTRGQLEGNRVVATIMSNLGLELALSQRGIRLTRTSVGDKYVLDELLRGGGSIGGEQSGHIIFPKISLAGDGMITALEVLRVIVESKRSLGELAGRFIRYPQFLINVSVRHKPPLASIPAISEAM
ncbi:MAG: phosphoglucosamine mutase, partial [Blastocatellia bacterium]|nr:phosphoglucosamine mutase [Blastocatellia bacterium]